MSTTRRQRQRDQRSRGVWKKVALWLLIAVPVLLVAAYLGARFWTESYLRSAEFRRLVGRRTSETLQAEGEFSPLRFSGLNVYAGNFKALGTKRAAFSTLTIEQLRAEVSLRRWKERVWQIEHFVAESIDVQLDGPRLAELPPTNIPASKPSPNFWAKWLPNRVEIGDAKVAQVAVRWGEAQRGGSLSGVQVEATPQEGGWGISGHGGTLTHAAFPPLEVGDLKLRYAPPQWFVQSADFRQGRDGTIALEGEVNPGKQLDLRAKIAQIEVTPLLSEDWRVRLHGDLTGELRVRSVLPAVASPTISGALRLNHGRLEALPVLEQIAAFTRLQQYRQIALSVATAEFEQSENVLRVTNLRLESAGVIRVEGGFTVTGGNVDGSFQVGVTPESLQWLPGSQERVFRDARGGYLWTPVRLSGPVNQPKEDLTPRLVAAAQGAVLEKVETTVRDATKTGTDLLKGTVDLLTPLIK